MVRNEPENASCQIKNIKPHQWKIDEGASVRSAGLCHSVRFGAAKIGIARRKARYSEKKLRCGSSMRGAGWRTGRNVISRIRHEKTCKRKPTWLLVITKRYIDAYDFTMLILLPERGNFERLYSATSEKIHPRSLLFKRSTRSWEFDEQVSETRKSFLYNEVRRITTKKIWRKQRKWRRVRWDPLNLHPRELKWICECTGNSKHAQRLVSGRGPSSSQQRYQPPHNRLLIFQSAWSCSSELIFWDYFEIRTNSEKS